MSKRYFTADICDEFGHEVTPLPAIFKNYGGKEVFEGEIVTLKTWNDNSLVREILSTEGKGRVLVIDGGGSTECALIGGNLALLGSQKNWSGAIVNGCVRDVLELKSIDFGVKAISSHPRKSVKAGVGEKNIDIFLGDVEVLPSQYLYSDSDGVVVAPMDLTPRIGGANSGN